MPSKSPRPSDDLYVTSLCLCDSTKCRGAASSPAPAHTVKWSEAASQLSILCGVMLRKARQTVCNKGEKSNHAGSADNCRTVATSDAVDSIKQNSSESLSVQLMNEVNEGVSSVVTSTSSPIITTQCNNNGKMRDDSDNFVVPESELVPYLVLVSLLGANTSVESGGQTKSAEKKKSSSTSSSKAVPSSYTSTQQQYLQKMKKKYQTIKKAGKLANSTDDWLLEPWDGDTDDDGGDCEDCQIIGYTPPPPSSSDAKLAQTLKAADDYCDMLDSALLHPPTSKPFFFANTDLDSGGGSTNNNAGSYPGSPACVKESPTKVGGAVTQCIELPPLFQRPHIEVSSIVPCVDSQHVIVVLSTKLDFLNGSNSTHLIDSVDSPCSSNTNTSSNRTNLNNLANSSECYCGGGLLVYNVTSEAGRLVFGATPVLSYPVSSPGDVITSTLLLPLELEDRFEEDSDLRSHGPQAPSDGDSGIPGHIVVTLASGGINILRLGDLSVVGKISPVEGEKFLSVTYCSGESYVLAYQVICYACHSI